MNYQNYQNVILLTSSDTKRAQVHLFLFTERTGFNMYVEYTQPHLTLLALVPCYHQGIES